MPAVYRVLVYPEHGFQIGQCLEHDICVRGRTAEDIRRALRDTIEAYADAGIELDRVPPAPEEFHVAWHEAKEPPVRVVFDGDLGVGAFAT